jgi:hypothetical protein
LRFALIALFFVIPYIYTHFSLKRLHFDQRNLGKEEPLFGHDTQVVFDGALENSLEWGGIQRRLKWTEISGNTDTC